MRLACSGLVDEDAGSVAGAGFLILRELLARGVEIDFYAERAWVAESRTLSQMGLTYLGFEEPTWISRLPAQVKVAVKWSAAPVVRASWSRIFGAAATKRHHVAPYDAVLSLGMAPLFTIRDVPTVSWLQGPLHTEVEALKRLRPLITSVQSSSYYYGLRAFYAPRALFDRHLLDSSDVLICGSKWARNQILARTGPSRRVVAIPYPVDLDHFRPAESPQTACGRPTILALGRIVPRKRLDLLVDALPVVLREFPHTRLRIVGAPAYAPKQLSLLEATPLREHIEHLAYVTRSEIPRLLQDAAVVVQTSESENFGSAIAEAQACGVPVVVGPTNGTRDYIDPMSRVFSTSTPAAVGSAIVEVLLNQRADPKRMADSARASAARWFTPSLVTERLVDLLCEATAGE